MQIQMEIQSRNRGRTQTHGGTFAARGQSAVGDQAGTGGDLGALAIERSFWLTAQVAILRVTLALAFSFTVTGVGGETELDWPQFRGPTSSGVAPGAGYPMQWDTNQNVAWSTEIPGLGWSSPIVAGGKVFLTSVVTDGKVEPPKKGLYFGGERPNPGADTNHWMVWCLDTAKGGILWKREVHSGPPPGPRHVKNTYASETPVTDGERVYAMFGNQGVYCLDMDGKVLWSKELTAKKTAFAWGTAASPVLFSGRLVIVQDNEEESSITALDPKSGDQVWRTARDERSNWATPMVWKHDEVKELVVPGRKKVRSYGTDGTVLWEFGGMSSIVIPTPLEANGLLYVSSGYVGDKTRPIFAIRSGAKGDISLKPDESTNSFIAWRESTIGPYNPSPIIYGDRLYVLYDFGFFACYDARTGKQIYERQRLNKDASAGFTSSPWAADGRIYCLSEDGDTYVIEAGAEYKPVGKNSLGEMCMATPAIAEKSFFIRTASRLVRISGGALAK